MTGLEELEMLAKETEELMLAEPSDRGMQRALMSIIFRIRHAAQRIKVDLPELDETELSAVSAGYHAAPRDARTSRAIFPTRAKSAQASGVARDLCRQRHFE